MDPVATDNTVYKEGLFLMSESHWTLLANLEQDLHFFLLEFLICS